jgi:hypothetical protein
VSLPFPPDDCIDGYNSPAVQRGEGEEHMTWRLDATALSALLDVREITPLQLLEQSLSRLEAADILNQPGTPCRPPT